MSENPVITTTTTAHGVLHAVMQAPPDNGPCDELLRALSDLVEHFERGREKVMILSSALDGCFAANGAGNPCAAETDEDLAFTYIELRRPLERLATCGRPSIAAIDGSAIGWGLQLALACTLRFCSPDARLALSDVRLGRIPAAGGTQRLPRLVGPGRALDLMLSGRVVTGSEALQIGLVERVTPDPVAGALELGASLAKSSAPAMAFIMSCVEAAMELPHEQGMAVERAAVLSTIDDAAATNGITARDRRPGAASL